MNVVSRISRRGFILGTLAAAMGLVAAACSRIGFMRRAFRSSAPSEKGAATSLEALAMVVLPSGAAHQAAEFIEARVRDGQEIRDLYVRAAQTLDELIEPGTGRRFSEMSRADGTILLTRFLGRSPSGEKAAPMGVSSEGRRHVERAMRDIAVRFYASADGWRRFGYVKAPGMAGDPRAYTRRP